MKLASANCSLLQRVSTLQIIECGLLNNGMLSLQGISCYLRQYTLFSSVHSIDLNPRGLRVEDELSISPTKVNWQKLLLAVVPPPLPPSVEEAYKRKCQQLKRRMNEVEESNDAAYLRVTRLRREIEKLRLERSFLLEQLSKRTPTNVDDSEGSPSPPPTVGWALDFENMLC